jgi:hypothetical protein
MLEIAGRATQGEWSQSSLAGGYVVGPKDLDFPVIAAVVEYNADGTIYKAFDNAEENLAHIATFDPSTCVELVREVVRLRGALNGDKRERCKHCCHYRLFPCANNCGCDCEYEVEDRNFSSED